MEKDNAPKMVSDALMGDTCRFVTIGGNIYTIYPVSIKTLLLAVRYFSQVEVGDKHSALSVLGEVDGNVQLICHGIACIIMRRDNVFTRLLARRLMKGTIPELAKAFAVAVDSMSGKDFFVLASLAKSVQKAVATQK